MGKLKYLACATLLILGGALAGCNGAADLADQGMTGNDSSGTIQQGDGVNDNASDNGPEIAEETPDQAGPDVAEETPDQAGPDDFDDGVLSETICQLHPEICDGVQEKKPELPGDIHQAIDGYAFEVRGHS